MSFYTYQLLQQLILPNILFLISELFSYPQSVISYQLLVSLTASLSTIS